MTQVLVRLGTAVFHVAGRPFAFTGPSAEFQAGFLVNANKLHCHCAEPLTSTRQLLLADCKLTKYNGFTAVNVECDAVLFDRQVSTYRRIFFNYNQQDANYFLIIYF